MIRLYVLVAAGGAIGSMARFWLAAIVTRFAGASFPWGTMLINILGSFAMGCLAATRVGAQPSLAAFAMVGLCGGFTTFSAFSLQTLELLRAGRAWEAAVNVIASVALCLTATSLSYWAMQR